MYYVGGEDDGSDFRGYNTAEEAVKGTIELGPEHKGEIETFLPCYDSTEYLADLCDIFVSDKKPIFNKMKEEK